MNVGLPSKAIPLQFLAAIRDPRLTAAWTLDDWQQVVRLGRRLRLLGRLAANVEAARMLETLPLAVQRHLRAELQLSRWRVGAMRWALDRIGAALQGCTYPIVLLKGAAYVGEDLSIARGRMPADVDILVPREGLDDAQARLARAGWQPVPLDSHDERYYREWSHEVPPMRHPAHRIEIDLHHNILPPVAATHVDARRLLERIRPSRLQGWSVLDHVDMVLHGAAHLFLDSDLRDRVRDLVDLDLLMRQFAADESSWGDLEQRARQLGLSEPLALACHFCGAWLGTPIPADVNARILRAGPRPLRRRYLIAAFSAVLQPVEPDREASIAAQGAALLLLARYHRNRLPLRLLIPHVLHKVAGKGEAVDLQGHARDSRAENGRSC